MIDSVVPSAPSWKERQRAVPPSGVKQPHCHQALAGLNWLTDSPPGEALADGLVSPATATVSEALTVQWSPPKHVSRIKRSQICLWGSKSRLAPLTWVIGCSAVWA